MENAPTPARNLATNNAIDRKNGLRMIEFTYVGMKNTKTDKTETSKTKREL